MREVLPEVFHNKMVKETWHELRLRDADYVHLKGLLHRFANGTPNSPEVAAIAGKYYQHFNEARRV